MDLQLATVLFKNLYDGVDGYGISAIGRNKLNTIDKSYTYGEVTPEGFYKILSYIKPRDNEKFYDLGSGTGKAVVLTSLFYPRIESSGIEIIPELYAKAVEIQERLNIEIKPGQGKDSKSIQFIHGSFLEKDFLNADIVFMHSTCFSDSLMEQLEKRIERLKKGTRIITVTKTLTSLMFQLLKREDVNMSWGKATIYWYMKIQ